MNGYEESLESAKTVYNQVVGGSGQPSIFCRKNALESPTEQLPTTKTISDASPDSVRAVAVETTPNPLSYWSLPSPPVEYTPSTWNLQGYETVEGRRPDSTSTDCPLGSRHRNFQPPRREAGPNENLFGRIRGSEALIPEPVQPKALGCHLREEHTNLKGVLHLKWDGPYSHGASIAKRDEASVPLPQSPLTSPTPNTFDRTVPKSVFFEKSLAVTRTTTPYAEIAASGGVVNDSTSFPERHSVTGIYGRSGFQSSADRGLSPQASALRFPAPSEMTPSSNIYPVIPPPPHGHGFSRNSSAEVLSQYSSPDHEFWDGVQSNSVHTTRSRGSGTRSQVASLSDLSSGRTLVRDLHSEATANGSAKETGCKSMRPSTSLPQASPSKAELPTSSNSGKHLRCPRFSDQPGHGHHTFVQAVNIPRGNMSSQGQQSKRSNGAEKLEFRNLSLEYGFGKDHNIAISTRDDGLSKRPAFPIEIGVSDKADPERRVSQGNCEDPRAARLHHVGFPGFAEQSSFAPTLTDFGCSNRIKSDVSAATNTGATDVTLGIDRTARFPPVPQSNYDLKKRICDSMAEESRRDQPTTTTTSLMGSPNDSDNKKKVHAAALHQACSAGTSGCERDQFPWTPLNGEHTSSNQHSGTRPGDDCRSDDSPNQAPATYQTMATLSSCLTASGSRSGGRGKVQSFLRSRRESPLDLSVKTVRQSADSTAQDDGDFVALGVLSQGKTCVGQKPSTRVGTDGLVSVSQSRASSASAPKIDFTPNFTGFHQTGGVQGDVPSSHMSEVSVSPPVESLKKFSGQTFPSAKFECDKRGSNSSESYYSGRRCGLQETRPDGRRRDRLGVIGSTDVGLRSVGPASNNFDNSCNHVSAAAVPAVDSWKVAFDQEIEQRFNLARPPLTVQTKPSGSLDVLKVTNFTSHGHAFARGFATSRVRSMSSAYPQTPVQTSATPYNPAYVQKSRCQPATPHDRTAPSLETIGQSPDPEQIIKQITKGVMPDYKLLQDKNVLSILRSSLQEKEAKLMRLREATRRKEKSVAADSRDKQSLPPFGAFVPGKGPVSQPSGTRPAADFVVASGGRSQQQGYLHEASTQVVAAALPSGCRVSCAGICGCSNRNTLDSPSDLDGLAAFLAARIRTKGELKQIGSVSKSCNKDCHQSDTGSVEAITSSTDSTGRSFFLVDVTSSFCLPKERVSSSSSPLPPPPLTDTLTMSVPTSPRGRLVPRDTKVEAAATTSSSAYPADHPQLPLRHNHNGICNSSEISVFDFRDSDPEEEMPLLERQTLDGLRKDRRTLSSKPKPGTFLQGETDPEKAPIVTEGVVQSGGHHSDSWNEAFDMFVDQLEKRPPKRTARRKRIINRGSFERSPDSEVKVGSVQTYTSSTPVPMKVENENAKVHSPAEREPNTDREQEQKRLERSTAVSDVVKQLPRMKSERKTDIPAMNEFPNPGQKSETLKNHIGTVKRKRRGLYEVFDGKFMEKESDVPKMSRRWEGLVKTDNVNDERDPDTVKKGKKVALKKNEVGKGDDNDNDDNCDGDDGDDDDDSLSLSGLESESSDTEYVTVSDKSSEGSEDEGSSKKKRKIMRTRLQTRRTKEKETNDNRMCLRSTNKQVATSPLKATKTKRKPKQSFHHNGKKKKKRKKSNMMTTTTTTQPFGDGSAFRPGWEEECYKFKQQLRMPEKLISISKPPKRPSSSLPDLDSYRNSFSRDSSDGQKAKVHKGIEKGHRDKMGRKDRCRRTGGDGGRRNGRNGEEKEIDEDHFDGGSDGDDDDDNIGNDVGERKNCAGIVGELGSTFGDSCGNGDHRMRNGKKCSQHRTSIINLLVRKYGNGKAKKRLAVKCPAERKSPRILPRGTNRPELLPTPSLFPRKDKDHRDAAGGGKANEVGKMKSSSESESTAAMYLGYFGRKTVSGFKEAFSETIGLAAEKIGTAALETRTRRQTRDLKKRATLIEVFGDERPASAPLPTLSREDDAALAASENRAEGMAGGSQKKSETATAAGARTRAKDCKKECGGMVTRGRGRLARGGRPGLRSAAVLRSNKALQMSMRHLNSGRKRSLDLLRLRTITSKKFARLVKSSEPGIQSPMAKKRLKMRSVRRKFRSGFDYIRKKKKLRKDGDSADGMLSAKEKRTLGATNRTTAESIEDIQNEMKNWVINKGLGETVLHRAARLGYADVAAYCLEKLACSPSPRDNAGYTPLHEACSRGHLDVAKLLLMYGASVSESAKGGIRPLHEAAENGFTELIRLLLSFGADPLLETYAGHTALSLVTDEEARRLIQHHLADVQGNVAPAWTFQGPSSLFDPVDSGCDPLREPPSPEPSDFEWELEISDAALPPLFRLPADGEPDHRWMLMTDLLSHARPRSRDGLIKQLNASSLREMSASDFDEQAKCCSLVLGSQKPRPKAAKVLLVRYDDSVRRLLDVERVVL